MKFANLGEIKTAILDKRGRGETLTSIEIGVLVFFQMYERRRQAWIKSAVERMKRYRERRGLQ
jgi:hypothetical protein